MTQSTRVARFRPYLIAFALILAVLIPVAAQSDVPYVYYYSRLLNAFVIERADGTDSRVFAQNAMPPEHIYVQERGWSPSGEWFAWTSTDTYNPLGHPPKRFWLANLDGTRLNLLDGLIGEVVSVYWSPLADTLLVVSRRTKNRTMTDDVYLIDAAEGRIAAHMSDLGDVFAVAGQNQGMYQPDFWAADGTDVFFDFNQIVFDAQGNAAIGPRTTRLLRMDGTFEDGLTLAQVSPRAVMQHDTERDYVVLSIPSPDSRYMVDLDDATLTDTQTGAQMRMRHFSGYEDYYTCDVNWHPDSEWFLREDNMVYAGSGCWGGIVAVNVTGTVQRELSGCGLGSGSCAGWLPERAIPHLTPGLGHPVIPEPFMTLEHEGHIMGVGWRRDGMALAVYEEVRSDSGREAERLLIWTLDGGAAALTGVFDVDYCDKHPYNGCGIEWSPDGTRIALTNALKTQIIDAATGETVLAEESSFTGWLESGEPGLSGFQGNADDDPARGLLARISRSGLHFDTAEIVDAATGEVLHRHVADGDRAYITALAFLPGGSRLALLEGDQPLIWDFNADTFQPLATFPGDYITDISASGPYLFGFGSAALVSVWDADTGERVRRLNRYSYSAAFSPDGRMLATAGGQALNLWDFASLLSPQSE